MSVYDFFKNIFGLPKKITPSDPSGPNSDHGDEFKKPVWIDEYVEEDDDILGQQNRATMFPVLSDPLEMHRYFEQQMQHMQEMMKNFSFFSSSMFDAFPDQHDMKRFDALEPPPEADSKSLRDEYLKYPNDADKSLRKDTDLDARVGAEGLGRIIDEVVPGERQVPAIPAPKLRFFGESITTQTIRKPDGTVETRTTKRRSDGTEETVVSIQKPDGSEDSHLETGLLPRGDQGMFPQRRPGDDFLFDIFDNFFRRN